MSSLRDRILKNKAARAAKVREPKQVPRVMQRRTTADPEVFDAVKRLDEAYAAKLESRSLRIKELEAALVVANARITELEGEVLKLEQMPALVDESPPATERPTAPDASREAPGDQLVTPFES